MNVGTNNSNSSNNSNNNNQAQDLKTTTTNTSPTLLNYTQINNTNTAHESIKIPAKENKHEQFFDKGIVGLPIAPSYIPNTTNVGFSKTIAQTPLLLKEWTELKLAKSQLQTASKISALMAGFAVVAMVEIDINYTRTPKAFIAVYSLVTVLFILSHLVSLLIASSILPTLTTIIESHSIELIKDSPHKSLSSFIKISWFISNIWGNFLMIILVSLILWIKFANFNISIDNLKNDTLLLNISASIAGTMLSLVFLAIMIIISFYIYARMNAHKVRLQAQNIEKLAYEFEAINNGNYSTSQNVV